MRQTILRHAMHRRSALLAAACLVVGLWAAKAEGQLGGLLAAKEEVPEITVVQLRNLKLDEFKQDDSPYVLVDARTEKESSVSLIPGAITKVEFEMNRSRYTDRTVIAYCTSGYRSEQYARELIRQGVTAKNFKGSILEWCRAQLPLVTPDGESTNRVHTYSSRNRVPEIYDPTW